MRTKRRKSGLQVNPYIEFAVNKILLKNADGTERTFIIFPQEDLPKKTLKFFSNEKLELDGSQCIRGLAFVEVEPNSGNPIIKKPRYKGGKHSFVYLDEGIDGVLHSLNDSEPVDEPLINPFQKLSDQVENGLTVWKDEINAAVKENRKTALAKKEQKASS